MTMDNYFTGIQLANMMLHRRLTIIGTVRKCKREVPECMKAAKSREPKLSTFGFDEQLAMTSYVPKRNKAVILLSSIYHDVSIIEDDAQKRPEIIHFYSKTKIGVDLVDQMIQTYACRRATRKWLFALFCNMLDIAALNTYTIFRKLHSEYKKSKAFKRRLFITELAESAIMPHMKNRQKSPQLQKPTKEAIIRKCGLSFACLSAQREAALQKRKRCALCETSRDKKA